MNSSIAGFLFLISQCCLGQEIPLVGLSELNKLMQPKEDTVVIVNFWATWCAPCVKELPYFEALKSRTFDKPIKVLLVSLDAPKDLKKRLLPFVKNKRLKWPVYLFNEPNPNFWINEIYPEWSGAIPASLFVTKSKRVFFEQSFTFDELIISITHFISSP